MGEPLCVLCALPARASYRKGTARYWECTRCGLLFQHPLPDPGEMQGFAESEYASGVYQEYVRARDLKKSTFHERLTLLRKYVPTGRLLDIGCACGFLIDVALDLGYDAYGVEFSAEAISLASPEAKPRITQVNADELGADDLGGAFDVLTAFDIVEHSLAPLGFLERTARLVAPGGILALATPNSRHPLRYVMRSHWPHLQPLQHTFLFSKKSMRAALERVGLHVLSIQRAYKVLSADYLATQIEEHNPAVHRVYRVGSRLLPRSLAQRPFRVNIGEMFAVARRPE